jgi:hypothetical protein
MRGHVLLVCLCAAAAAPAAAQEVTPLQPLQFGGLFPGVDEVVTIVDAQRRGAFLLEGRGTFHVRFIVPDELLSADGFGLVMRLGAQDGGYASRSGGTPVPFDPEEGVTVVHPGGGSRTWFYIGGTARADGSQRAGGYAAPVILLAIRVDSE